MRLSMAVGYNPNKKAIFTDTFTTIDAGGDLESYVRYARARDMSSALFGNSKIVIRQGVTKNKFINLFKED